MVVLWTSVNFTRPPGKNTKLNKKRRPHSKTAKTASIQQLGVGDETALGNVEDNQNVRPDMPMAYEALDKFGVYSVYYNKDVRRQSDEYVIYVDRPQQAYALPPQQPIYMYKT